MSTNKEFKTENKEFKKLTQNAAIRKKETVRNVFH
jgi:hypothetical protein